MKRFVFLSINLLLFSFLISCSSEENPIEALTDNTYSGNNLELYYNGNLIPNKSIDITKNDTDYRLTCYSEFNLTNLSINGFSGMIEGPGIIPGTQKLILDIKPLTTGKYMEFSGSESTDYCNFSYSGYCDNETLRFFINDAVLTRPFIQTAWTPAKINYGDFSLGPLVFNLSLLDESLPINEMNELVNGLLNYPLISTGGRKVSINELIINKIISLSFLPDGNFLVSYISTLGGAASLSQTSPNRIQYVTTDSKINFFADPTSIGGALMMALSGSTPSSEINLTDKGLFPSDSAKDSGENNTSSNPLQDLLLQKLLPMVKEGLRLMGEGVSFEYQLTQDNFIIYIDTENVVNILQKLITEIAVDSQIILEIKQAIESNPEFNKYLPHIEKIMEDLPGFFQKIIDMKLQFFMKPYSLN